MQCESRSPSSSSTDSRCHWVDISAIASENVVVYVYLKHRRIQEEIEEEVKRAELLTKDSTFNERHCLRCFDKFLMLFNPKVRCVGCHYNVCKKCAPFNDIVRQHVCNACLKQRFL